MRTFSLLLAVAAWMLAGATARGTTFASEDGVCPVCGSKVHLMWVESMTIGQRDPDFCPHAVGANPVGASVNVCEKCCFAGYPDDFKLKLTQKQKDRLRAELSPMWKIKEGESMPRVGRLDLAAQVYAILGRDPLRIADQYLMASWSVRLAGSASGKLPEGMVRQAYAMKKELGALVGESDEMGRGLLEKSKTLEGDRRRSALILAMDELRLHGEFEAARDAIEAIRPLVSAEAGTALVKDLEEDVQWSRHFEKKAADLMAANIGKVKEANERAGKLYLCGELYRRCGDAQRARQFFRRCREAKPPQELVRWLERQEKLVPGD